MSIRTFLSLALTAVVAAASAQQLDVYAHNNIAIEEDASYTTPLNSTHFGPVRIGQTKQSSAIWIQNSYDSSISIVSITISGSGAGGFSLSYYPSNLQPGSVMSAYITAKPTAVARYDATVKITTNLPGSDATYSFPITCDGVASEPDDFTDLYFYSSPNLPKIKINKKTGVRSIQLKDSIGNDGPANCTGGVVVQFITDTPLLYLTRTVPLPATAVKPIPASISGKKPKTIKTKAKLTLPINAKYIFTITGPEKDIQDPIWYNNVIRREVPLPL